MRLTKPNIKYKDSYIEAVKEYKDAGFTQRTKIYDMNIEELENNFSKYIANFELESQGKNLPEGYVQKIIYWLINNDEFIGTVSIRHSLTENLRQFGGHIGYDIRPSKRRQGYGKKILQLAIHKAKTIGIKNILITCDVGNIGSKKIIETNGGILENKLIIDPNKPEKLRYWIRL